ncbi:FAD-binding oxidoreductase [Aromatoleum diolicum]|uniref:FAD-binding oxidoreductase n=1 Tax=Aromatoleum diolicum TaxID=75796 RepID=UPI001B7D03FC|nr:hypothetical protein [Aromatoleum diolicum]
MEVVTAGGDVLRVSADENEDLFWALRGGSGNFGIVTSFEYRLFPVGPEILGGAIAWRGEDAKQVLDTYRDLWTPPILQDDLADVPNEPSCNNLSGLLCSPSAAALMNFVPRTPH